MSDFMSATGHVSEEFIPAGQSASQAAPASSSQSQAQPAAPSAHAAPSVEHDFPATTGPASHAYIDAHPYFTA